MLQRNTLRNDKLPLDRQVVEVRAGNGEWQPATYRNGEFVDMYGMPLSRHRITGWRPASTRAGNQDLTGNQA
jgi:hypothetical protein